MKDINIIDIDTSVINFLKSLDIKVINEDGSHRQVPIVFCTPERWNKIKLDGGLDEKGTIITPVIAIKRNSISFTNETYGIAQNPRLYRMKFVVEHPKSKIIDRMIQEAVKKGFSFKDLKFPNRRYKIYKIAIPKFLLINYTIEIFCSFVVDANSILEQIIDKNRNQDILYIPLHGKKDAFITARYRNELTDSTEYELNSTSMRDIIYDIEMEVNGFMFSKFNELIGNDYVEIIDGQQTTNIVFDE